MEEKNAPAAVPNAAGSAAAAKADRKTAAGASALVFLLYMGYRLYAMTKLLAGRFSFLDMLSYAWWTLCRGKAFHSLDYGMGFVPRALTGQLLTLVTGGAITERAAGIYLLLAYVLTYALFSVVVGILIEKAVRTENYIMAMFPFLFVLAPVPVWFRSFMFANYDTFMLLFALLAFLALAQSRHERLLWLVPVFSCLGILTNYAFALLFFPLIFALQYYAYIQSGLKKSRLAQLLATTGSSGALALYSVAAPYNSEWMHRLGLYRYSCAQAIAYLEGKLGHVLEEADRLYIANTVFGMDARGDSFVAIPPGRLTAFSPLAGWFHPKFYGNALLICAPIVVFTCIAWWVMAKGETGFLKKSPFYLFMLAPCFIFPAFMVFQDLDRLVWSVLLTQLLLMIYVFLKNGQSGVFNRMREITKKDKPAIAGIAVFFLAILLPLLIFKTGEWLNAHPGNWGDVLESIA